MATYLHRDTQGPCPDGWHVPTKEEWQAVCDAGVALGQWSSSDGNSFRIKMKMPFAGYRSNSSSDVYSQGFTAFYWTSTAYSNISNSYFLGINSNGLSPHNGYSRAYGFSLRCFKNFPLKPSSSWTTIYAGSNGAGIFHNPSEGVISISSDGTNWITVADKNLGATQVYNDGDTLSEANCGKYYQWGNNYGFPWTGTVTTSSTKVNASSYGPGNYYSSNTFITVSAEPYDWSSVQNDNLRGGVTDLRPGGPTRIIKKFYHMGVEYKIKGGKPTPPTPTYKTYTVQYTEAATPVFTYLDDAETMTAGSSDWDEIFGYYPCLLNTSGVETAKLNPNDYSKTIDGATANITSGDNVMVMFPRRGYKISKSGSTVTVSVTTDPNKEGYCYDAFRRGSTQKDKFYLGAYHGSLSGSVLKSWSGKSITVNHNITNGRTYAQANGTGYEQWAFNQLTYLQCLWLLKYKSLNSQAALGQGYTGGSAATTTGATNTNGLNYGSTSTTTHVKLFGIEDFWGNTRDWIDGIYCDSSYNIWTGTDNFTSTAMTTNYTNQGSAGISSNIGNYMSAIQGTSTTGFIAKAVSGSSSTYYSDYGGLYAGCFPCFGGAWSIGAYAGVFRLYVLYSASDAYSNIGSRLMFL